MVSAFPASIRYDTFAAGLLGVTGGSVVFASSTYYTKGQGFPDAAAAGVDFLFVDKSRLVLTEEECFRSRVRVCNSIRNVDIRIPSLLFLRQANQSMRNSGTTL